MSARAQDTALKSLAPEYVEARHVSYVRRLEGAVDGHPENRNIALSGPYGTGKSSILDAFESGRKTSTLRLAISTLAPEADGSNSTLTNRIQKEILKQLIYSATPRTLSHSRFSRDMPISWPRSVGDSAIFVGVVAAALAFMDRLPSLAGTGSTHSGLTRASLWVAAALLAVGVVAVMRVATHNRFFVSDVSAAGATVTLSKRSNTYFDEYLDEIVAFFDQESIDFVILEDLDRFDDPAIFQSLRELNTLLNNTPARLKKIAKKEAPLRFIYAMRDSLFEKLGTDASEEYDDAARAETVRANRTKFFDVVIPVVPFISHRTAREHLLRLIEEVGATEIDRSLIELVARYATDMRLLINIRNEYLVFVERLLEADQVAPDLSADHLFALVAYKHFHLKDFEAVARRASRLDRLFDQRRRLVRLSVAQLERRRRDLLAGSAQPPSLKPYAVRMGARLTALGTALRNKQGWPELVLFFTVGSTHFGPADASTPEFWDAVVEARSINIEAAANSQSGMNALLSLEEADLEGLFAEALDGRWNERRADASHADLEELDREIDFLRAADFRDLASADRYKLSFERPDGPSELTFAQLVDECLQSDLARDLVKRGFIDQNFTMHSGQFYGDFAGIDVATFIVQAVQTNTMYLDYQFTSPGAVPNLLREVGGEFLRTVSAFNIDVLDYLLREDADRADVVADHMVANFGDDAREFLRAYLNSGHDRAQLAGRLSSQPWAQVFSFLTSDDEVPSDIRVELVDAALLSAQSDTTYELGDGFSDFIVEHFAEMSTFTRSHPDSVLETVMTLLARADVILPSLDGVDEQVRALVVQGERYELTAPNLRTALGVTGAVSLDAALEDDAVYRYCLSAPRAYLDLVDGDDLTAHAVESAETLVAVLGAADDWDDDSVRRLTAMASPSIRLKRLTDVPPRTWPALTADKLIRPSLENVEAYRSEHGEIDRALGDLLSGAGAIDLDGAAEDGDSEATSTPAATAVAILNGAVGIPSPEMRVQLVRSLGLDKTAIPLPEIEKEPGTLFALLITHELVADDAETFTYIHDAGWAAVEPAIVASANIETFVSPGHVAGMLEQLFESEEARARIGNAVLADLAVHLPEADSGAMKAAARFALATETPLPLDQVQQVAANCADAPDLVFQLLQLVTPAPDAASLTAVLNALGPPYDNLTTRAKAKFEVPLTDASKTVFDLLASAEICSVSKKRSKPVLEVELA